MKKFLIPLFTFTFALHLCGATNLVSNTAIVTNRVQGIVTYTMSNGVARVQDPSGKLVGTAEERALKVAAEGQVDIASAAADAAGTAKEEWREFTATTDVKVVYIDAGFTQDLPALAPNLCGWVAGSFYDREKGEDHYYVWFNREMDAPPSMCARIVSESGTNWLDGALVDWGVTNWVQNGREVEWRGAGKYSAEVEYLRGDGLSYIDTGIVLSSNHRVFLNCFLTRSDSYIFGCRDSASEKNISAARGGVGSMLIADFNSSSYVTYRAVVATEVVGLTTFELSREKRVISGVNVARNENVCVDVFSCSQSALLFGCSGNPLYAGKSIDSVYKLSIWLEDELVLDFIPVLDLAGRPAMYDRVSGKLFYNQGTGEFSYGPVTAAPVPCRELVVPRRNANCVLKTGTVITLGGKDGFDADIHKVNIEVNGEPTVTTSAQLPLFYAVTRSGTNTVTRAYTNGFVNVENGFVKEPTND